MRHVQDGLRVKGEELVAGLKLRDAGGCGMAVVWAAPLALVAAVHTIPHALNDVLRQLRVSVLNGLTREALAGVNHTTMQRLPGAVPLAGMALAASQDARMVRREHQFCNQFAEYEE